jgi:hypothetical protein
MKFSFVCAHTHFKIKIEHKLTQMKKRVNLGAIIRGRGK